MYEQVVRHTNSPAEGALGLTATGLGKQFGDLWALRDLDLAVPTGTVLGLLGHNGAGKTTAIRILTTLSAPTTGSAMVAGLDVVADAPGVRRRIGVASQQATVDGLLTARANLEMVGRLYHLPRAEASTAAGAGHFAFMAQSTIPLPSAAGDAAANPNGFDRVAYLPELEDQVAAFFAVQWR